MESKTTITFIVLFCMFISMESINVSELEPNREIPRGANLPLEWNVGRTPDFELQLDGRGPYFVEGYEIDSGILAHMDDGEQRDMYFESRMQFINHINEMTHVIDESTRRRGFEPNGWTVKIDKLGIEGDLDI